MQTVQIVQSSRTADRLAQAAAFIRARPPGSELLVVAPSRDAADDLGRTLTLESSADFGVHRFSVLQLAARLAAVNLASSGLAPASQLGMEAVAARAAFQARERNLLPRLAAVSRFPGFTRALASTMNELRLAGITARPLADGDARATDVDALLALFEAQLASAWLTDRAGILDRATDALSGPARLEICSQPLVLLDVPVTSERMRTFVAALCATAPAVLATLQEADRETQSALEQIAHARASRVAVSEPMHALGRLRRYLFAGESPPQAELDASVTFFSAPGEGRECVEIARRILGAAKQGTRFDEMAVFLRLPGVYSPLLDTALQRAHIPAFFARGTERPDPAGRAFLALLACRAEKLSAKRFAEYLSFAQVPVPNTAGAPPLGRNDWVAPEDELLGAVARASQPGRKTTRLGHLSQPSLWDALPASQTQSMPPDSDAQPTHAGNLRAPWRWEEYLVEAAVIGNKDRWRRRLAGFQRELGLKAAELRKEEMDSPRLVAIERDLEHLGHLQRFALPVIDILDAYPAQSTWGEWIERLSELAPMVLRHPERVLALLAELRPMSAVSDVGIDEVRDVLTDRLANLAQDPPSHRYGRVLVATPEDARARSFKLVFIPGLAERVFPQPPREDPLLLDAERRALGHGLHVQEDRSHNERLLLRLAIAAAEGQVVLSYPRLGATEARPRVPSFYGLDVMRAARGTIPDSEAFERETANVAQARLAWPAPPEPELAIDAFEHDLAVLEPLLHVGSPDTARGRARYLLELSPLLARSLRARWLRWDRRWSPADGLVRISEHTAARLDAERLQSRPYSVSALQRFSTCPYQFFLAAIHRLTPRREALAVVQLDPLTRGRIFHHVQAETLRALWQAEQQPLSATSWPTAERLLTATLARVTEAYRDELAPPIAGVWRDEVETMRADLRIWLQRLLQDADWVPEHCEFSFGLPLHADAGDHTPTTHVSSRHDHASRAEPVRIAGGWQLRGAVDLIERCRDGTRLRVTDHKTGVNRTTDGTIVAGGELLQPVLYGLAVEQALGQEVSDCRLSFCTARGGFSAHNIPLAEFARLYAGRVFELIDSAIASGQLPPSPRADACARCDFRTVCGPHEERRTAIKDDAPRAALLELRSLP